MVTEEQLPEWPGNHAAHVKLHIIIERSVDEAFTLLFCGPNEFQEQFHQAASNKDPISTPWVSSLDELSSPKVSNGNGTATARSQDASQVHQGMVRKTSFISQSSLTGSYTTQELWHLVEAQQGQHYTCHVSVKTTVPYGDKFVAHVRHELVARDPTSCTLKVAVALVFTSHVNRLIKRMVNKGANEGTSKNFRFWEETLGRFAPLRPVSGRPHAAPRAAVGVEKVEVGLPAALSKLETWFGTPVKAALQPWAHLLHSYITQVPLLQSLDSHIVLYMLCCITALATLRLLLAVLRFVELASASPQDSIAYMAHYLLKVLPFPGSISEVLAAAALLVLAREINNRLATLLPAPSENLLQIDTTPSGTGVQAANTAVEATKGDTPPAAAIPSEDLELTQGVQYDGYTEALASATEAVHKDESGLGSMAMRQSEAALEKFRTGLQSLSRGVSSLTSPPGTGRDQTTTTPISPTSQPGTPGVGGSLSPTAAAGTSTPSSLSLGDNGTSTKRVITGYTAPDLPHALMAHAVVDEVFENERLQPFRGWGSTWPGHFLPTDKVLRWSLRDPVAGTGGPPGEAPVSSERIEEVTPPLDPRWRWIEPDWRLDLDGVAAGCVDHEGWTYGLDFPWVEFPFNPGQGKKSIKDFVRRRRWLRTRVPIAVEQEYKRLHQHEEMNELVQNATVAGKEREVGVGEGAGDAPQENQQEQEQQHEAGGEEEEQPVLEAPSSPTEPAADAEVEGVIPGGGDIASGQGNIQPDASPDNGVDIKEVIGEPGPPDSNGGDDGNGGIDDKAAQDKENLEVDDHDDEGPKTPPH